MEKNWLTKSSFKFGTTDMFQRFGIMLTGEPEDVLLPALRPRKVKIPNRHGEYDFGAKYYEERGLKLPCTTVKTRDRISVREISYLLSKKSEIRVWNEPEKYYIGRIYDATVLNQIRNIGNEFDLVFVCEPFAYGSHITKSFSNNAVTVEYQGTAETPAVITITNTGSAKARRIQIILTKSI